ncbi:mechanosensitive ion channel family protein [Micrococcus endophyticus]|uniref:mechanosensitive ion channel family protein n=1 Tax=Micrococcus endophyticus TaxID=455343 RepID=UPI003805FB26
MDLPPITPTAVGVGLAVAVVGYALGRLVGSGVTWALTRGGRSPSAARVFGSLVAGGLTVLALGAAVTVVFPSVKPVDVFGGIGVISIAAGIAFQTVLGNMFAGMVILARDRFRVGDQIAVADHAGTVVEMGLSATGIKTFDGRLVLLPNQILHSNAVTVQTGFNAVRSSVFLDLDDATDLDRARAVAVETMAALPSVLTDPAPQALLTSVGVTTVELELRFWSGARQMETREAQDAVIASVLRAFTTQGVRTGNDVRIVDAGPELRRALDRLVGTCDAGRTSPAPATPDEETP